ITRRAALRSYGNDVYDKMMMERQKLLTKIFAAEAEMKKRMKKAAQEEMTSNNNNNNKKLMKQKQHEDDDDNNNKKKKMIKKAASNSNGLAERMNMTLLNKVRCLLIQSGLPDSFWAEATVTAAYLINRDVVFNESLIYKDTLKGTGATDSGKEVEFEVKLQGSRVEPTVDPHTEEIQGMKMINKMKGINNIIWKTMF
ncbi:retrovirus-related pol polyprotein from transposon TNT 1-94, partial [Tanacetum coccineum]